MTYVLRPRGNAQTNESRPGDQWQWWRISFSTDDAKTRQAESNRDSHAAPNNADIIGYTARKVREVEVLRAARVESKSVLLVYASADAVRAHEDQLPLSLRVSWIPILFVETLLLIQSSNLWMAIIKLLGPNLRKRNASN